jgi:hypothetical protein
MSVVAGLSAGVYLMLQVQLGFGREIDPFGDPTFLAAVCQLYVVRRSYVGCALHVGVGCA